MKKFLLLLSLFSIGVFADHGCFNSREVSYLSTELARESRQMAQGGRWTRHGNRFADEARRLARAAKELAEAANFGTNCKRLERMFFERVEPAFRDLMQEARGPRRDDNNDDLRDIRRAFQDLKRELMEDNGRGRGPGRGRGGRGPDLGIHISI
jgi:hypothetical protein